MGLWSRLFNRPMSPDRFAKLILKRVRQSGETRPIEYVREDFELRVEQSRMYLGNLYALHERADPEDRESAIKSFLATWHTAGFEPPTDFDDAKADLLPSLRARSYVANIDELLRGKGEGGDLPYEVIGEHLAATLVYDLPHSMQTVGSKQLEDWGITFYEAMEVAKRNLAETTDQYGKLGSICAMVVGDAYDATRLLLDDHLDQMEVEGDTLAAVPNRERLYVVGSDDEEGLAVLAALVEQDLTHERSLCGRLFRRAGGDWQPWLPPADHPTYQAWRRLAVQSAGQEYHEQKERLDKQNVAEGIDAFVASFSATQLEATGQINTYCAWSQSIESWLPETDSVVLSDEQMQPIARVPWETLLQAAGDFIEPLGVYPERWRVSVYPPEETVARLAAEHPIA